MDGDGVEGCKGRRGRERREGGDRENACQWKRFRVGFGPEKEGEEGTDFYSVTWLLV